MDAKLTLKLDAQVIAKAKQYARRRKISLSRLVESYLDALSSEGGAPGRITPQVDRLSGVIHLPPEFDHRQSRSEDLEKKHR